MGSDIRFDVQVENTTAPYEPPALASTASLRWRAYATGIAAREHYR